MDRIMNELKHIRKDVLRLPELCAQKMNKTGVFYKAGNIEKEEEIVYGDNSESRNFGGVPRKEWVYQDDLDDFITPAKTNVRKDDEDVFQNSHEKRPYYCTPEYFDSFKGDKDDPVQVPEVSDEKEVTSIGTDDMASRASGSFSRHDDVVQEVRGKRNRRVSQLVKSPFVLIKPTKRAKRSAKAKLFEEEGVENSSDDYDVVKASVQYVRAYEHSRKHSKKEIFNDGTGEGLSAQRACKILNHQWLSGDVINAYSSYLSDIVSDDRHMMATWLVSWLLEWRPDKQPGNNKNEVEAKKNGPVNRCADEYLKKLRLISLLTREIPTGLRS